MVGRHSTGCVALADTKHDFDLVLELETEPSDVLAELSRLVAAVASREYTPKLFAEGNVDFQMTRGLLNILSNEGNKEDLVAFMLDKNLPIDEIEVRQALSDAEVTLAGEKIDDAQLVKLVARMRRILAQLKK